MKQRATKELEKIAKSEWTTIRAAEMRDAERYEALQKQLAEEAEKKRLRDVELATSAPGSAFPAQFCCTMPDLRLGHTGGSHLTQHRPAEPHYVCTGPDGDF